MDTVISYIFTFKHSLVKPVGRLRNEKPSFFLRTEDWCLACENIAQVFTASTTKATPSDPQPRHPFWVPESTNWLWMRNNNCRMVNESTSENQNE